MYTEIHEHFDEIFRKRLPADGFCLLGREHLRIFLYREAIFANNEQLHFEGADLMSKNAKMADLEPSLQEINVLIEKMEQGDLTLEQALSHFEHGITLIKSCQKILQDAEQKVQILVQNSNNIEAEEELKPYDLEENGEPPK